MSRNHAGYRCLLEADGCMFVGECAAGAGGRWVGVDTDHNRTEVNRY